MKVFWAAFTTAAAALLCLPGEAFAFPSSRRLARPVLSTAPAATAAGKTPRNVPASLQPRFATGASDVSAALSPGSMTATSGKGQQSFDDFDYTHHWYPVSWARDVPPNEPTRVTLFDVDYVLARTIMQGDQEEKQEVFYAMIDRCPHKKVALSEGRITASGAFQCSYHGWSFDGESGKCIEIPQTAIAKHSDESIGMKHSSSSGRGEASSKKRREDATAVAVRVVQGMVWLQPSYTPLEALAALERGDLRPPPRIPEIDMPGYRMTPAVRDFPIDWTVLMENIMDPDHGYFAHSSSGAAKGFDWYSADGVDNPVEVDEDFDEGTWKIVSSVNAVEKLIKYNRNVRTAGEGNKPDEKKIDEAPPKLATTTLVAPSLIYLGRRTNSTFQSPFITAFWVCPTGTGKSRFMSAAVGKTPFSIPRWLVHMNLNNFLDQDTFLLCGQHRAVLTREAEGYLQLEGDGTTGPNNVRKSTYVYRSPSERLPVRVGQFFDATLARAPNRKEGVLAWYKKNANNHKLFEPWPSREAVLDRYEQHTTICQDSMDVVRRCDKVMKTSKLVGLVLAFLKVAVRSLEAPAMRNPFMPGTPILAVFRGALSLVGTLFNRVAASLLRDKAFYSTLALAFLSYNIASRIKREFFFKTNDELHRQDIKYIAKNWVDL